MTNPTFRPEHEDGPPKWSEQSGQAESQQPGISAGGEPGQTYQSASGQRFTVTDDHGAAPVREDRPATSQPGKEQHAAEEAARIFAEQNTEASKDAGDPARREDVKDATHTPDGAEYDAAHQQHEADDRYRVENKEEAAFRAEHTAMDEQAGGALPEVTEQTHDDFLATSRDSSLRNEQEQQRIDQQRQTDYRAKAVAEAEYTARQEFDHSAVVRALRRGEPVDPRAAAEVAERTTGLPRGIEQSTVLITENHMLKAVLTAILAGRAGPFFRADAGDLRVADTKTVVFSRNDDGSILVQLASLTTAPAGPSVVTREQTGDPDDPPEQDDPRRARRMALRQAGRLP